ncbi:MAG: DUF1957 domain-containing protein [Firmicutes bacterium]|nr:DUF1957 domain-containing protein [Bacillota bacterium]
MPKAVVIDKKAAKKPVFDNKPLPLNIVKSDVLSAEIAGNKLIVRWEDSLHSQVNYLDEDLFLILADSKNGSTARQERINFLAEKEMDIPFGGEYILKLAVLEKFHVGIATTSEYVPPLTFIPEGINRYLIAWGELDWNHIRTEVEREQRVNWDQQVDVVLKIERFEGDSQTPIEEWRYPGMKDMDIVGGKIKEITLLAVRKSDRSVLKEIFRVYAMPGKEKRVIDEIKVKPCEKSASLELVREVHETDTNHLTAKWEIPDSSWKKVEKAIKETEKKVEDFDVVLKLFYKAGEDWHEFNPMLYKKTFGTGNWFFGNIPGGTTYQAKLVMVDRETKEELAAPLLVSQEIYFPRKENSVTLLPIDDKRIFAYWHLNRDEVYKTMKEKHDAEPGSIKAYIRFYHDYAGGLHHHAHLDREISIDYADNFYLAVDSDRVYRAQIVAIADGWKTEFITGVSNPVQTNRIRPGNAHINYTGFRQPQDHPTNRRIDSAWNTAGYSQGKLIMHLHAHLPFVWERINYGTSGYWRPGGYVEEWYHEAMRETYVPLVRIFDQLISEGVDFKISIDISPTLSNMMRNPVLQEEFLNYVDSLIALAKTEIERTSREEPWYNYAAKMHLREFMSSKATFLKYGRDLTKAFKKFQDMGKLEILTCGATHGFLPLMGSKHIEAIRGQIKTAVLDYENTFGRKPYGIWLPECAYTPGIEHVLQEFGIRYFFSETHTIMLGDSQNEFGVHAPVYVRGSEVAVFARDPETGKQVWSGDEGYPGDPDYLEFHLRGGPLKYNRITDRRGTYKQPYVPEWAEAKAASHANHFMQNRNFRFDYIKNWFWKKPVVVATYDAELFGHHWYEGPRFLYYLLKKLHFDQNQTELTTGSHYLAEYNYNQELYPTPSSWGDKGTFDKWMYGSVSWMYRHMNDAVAEMINLSSWGKERELHYATSSDPGVRMLSQMARELLLAQNSDAGFNISNGHFIDRMKDMFFVNLNNFWKLANMFVTYMNTGEFDEVTLRKMERSENIFPVIDPFVYAGR